MIWRYHIRSVMSKSGRRPGNEVAIGVKELERIRGFCYSEREIEGTDCLTICFADFLSCA